MRKHPEISIIMGIYNCDKYISESIDSIINQSYSNWELIMCDDGSTDRTFDIAIEYKNKYPNKIILIKNNINKGLNYTLNHCLKYANGNYIARQDGDDISNPKRLEKEIEFLQRNSEYALVGTNMILFDEKGQWGVHDTIEKPDKFSFAKRTPFCHATCLIKKEVLNEVNGYSEDKKLLRVEDYHLWFKIYSKGYFGYNINENLYEMRDDRDATKRRLFKTRFYEARVKYIGFKMLKMPIKTYISILRPVLIAFLPQTIYEYLHRKSLTKPKG